MSRVLSTDQARSAIERIRVLATQQLTADLGDLTSQGRVLSDPNVWDGVEAMRFRSDTWPSVEMALRHATEALQNLQLQAETINQNIMAAGGNV